MAYPLILATLFVGFDIAYRYYAKGTPPDSKTMLSWGTILIILSILEKTDASEIADMFCYLLILIISLNDGYEFASSI